MSYLLLILAFGAIGASISCFWRVYKIRQELFERAGDDPFAIALTDQTEPKNRGGTLDDVLRLNRERVRYRRAGQVLIISGIVLAISALALRPKRKGIQTLGMSAGHREEPS